jgi:DNA-binding NarL/FixJ family response regulator
MIRILLVDDQALLCEVLKTWLEVEKDFEVVGIANNGEEGIDKVETLRPDIVLIDIEMPGMDGLNATSVIVQRFPHVKVIVLSAHDDDAYVGKSVRAGAKGYILKSTTAEELASKIRTIYTSNDRILDDRINNIVDLASLKEEILQEMKLVYQKQLETQLAKLPTNGSNGSGEYVKDFAKVQGDLEQRLSQLQTTSEETYKEVYTELLNAQSKLGETNRNFSAQVNQQLINFKKELEEQLATTVERWSQERAALQEWAVQREEIYPSTDELELKFRNELMAAINPMRNSIRDLGKQVRFMRGIMVGVAFVSVFALAFGGLAFVWVNNNNVSSNSQQPSQTAK